jgi:hypothetical protein
MVGKIKIDFNILPILDSKLIQVADGSDWYGAEDKQATILIFPPGSSKSINNVFAKHKINKYTSSNLQLGCEDQDLSDGIWTITLKSAYEGLEKTRYFLKTDRFKIEWYKEWINTGLDYTDTKDARYDKLVDCNKHIISAEACTLDGNFTMANSEFQEAQKKFNRIRKCQYTI